MKYFVLVYNRHLGKLLYTPEEYGEPDRQAALQRRFALEADWRGEPDVEIVVLGSESEAQIRSTHGRYFKSVAELASANAWAAAR